MRLDQIDFAIEQRNHRKEAIRLRDAARHGGLDITLRYKGDIIDPCSVIDAAFVRESIVQGCDELISDKEKELTNLGVDISNPKPDEDSI